MNKNEICFKSASDIVDMIKRQEITSQEITEIIIERIEKINPIINAYCTPTFDIAREKAKNADEAVRKGEKIGLLHGIPTSIKDETDTKGIRTTYGCILFENNIPKKDDISVMRLKDAGAVILGKTNTSALGFKAVTDNVIFGATKNPWNLERTPGGSSGGAAAAVASGLGPLATGSDGGGSVRIPSSFCGTFGFKPSFGRIPHNIMKTSGIIGTLVQRGPIVRYVKDASLMLDVLIGEDDCDRYSLPKPNFSYSEKLKEEPNKLKIGYTLDFGYTKVIEPEVEEGFLNAIKRFEKLNWSIEKTRINLKKAASIMELLWFTGFHYLLGPSLSEWEDKMDPGLVDVIKGGKNYSTLDIKLAEIQREQIYDAICRQFKKFDILITPVTACTAFELGKNDPEIIDGIEVTHVEWHYAYPFNLSGHPAASIPCGWSSEGLPIGMQIIGKRLDDATVLQVSRAFEKISPWQDKKPNFN